MLSGSQGVNRAAGGLAILMTFALAACAGISNPLSASQPASGAARSIPATCVVAAPLSLAPQLLPSEDDLPGLFGAYLTEALTAKGLRVVGASELALFLAEGPGQDVGRAYAQRVAFVAEREFGCDVVAVGRLERFRERSGEAMGSTQAASVAFDLRFYGAPGGQPLWQGRFDETQKTLTENLWRAAKYPGGGTRWLTANEFARFGVGELVLSVPLKARATP